MMTQILEKNLHVVQKMKRLNFGSGMDIKQNWDNADWLKSEGTNLIFNFEKFPYPIKDNTYDYVYTRSVLEHLATPDKALLELWRICKHNATIEIIVPSYNNRSAYDGIEHKHYFSKICFELFVNYPYDTLNSKKYFEIIINEEIPTNIGKFIPKSLREKLSLFLFGIVSYVHVKLKVLKH